MTKRDKLILKIMLFAVLIILPGYFYTRHLVKDIFERHARIEEMKAQEQNLQSMMEMNERKREYAAELASRLNEIMPNTGNFSKSYEIHYFFNDIATKHNLVFSSLMLGKPEIIAINHETTDESGFAITPEQFERFENTEYGIDIVSDAETDFNSLLNYETHIYKQPADFSASGSLANVFAAVDEINSYSDYITIDKLSVPDMNAIDDIEAEIPLSIYYAIMEEKEVN